jgi:hypothetical protein
MVLSIGGIADKAEFVVVGGRLAINAAINLTDLSNN